MAAITTTPAPSGGRWVKWATIIAGLIAIAVIAFKSSGSAVSTATSAETKKDAKATFYSKELVTIYPGKWAVVAVDYRGFDCEIETIGGIKPQYLIAANSTKIQLKMPGGNIGELGIGVTNIFISLNQSGLTEARILVRQWND